MIKYDLVVNNKNIEINTMININPSSNVKIKRIKFYYYENEPFILKDYSEPMFIDDELKQKLNILENELKDDNNSLSIEKINKSLGDKKIPIIREMTNKNLELVGNHLKLAQAIIAGKVSINHPYFILEDDKLITLNYNHAYEYYDKHAKEILIRFTDKILNTTSKLKFELIYHLNDKKYLIGSYDSLNKAEKELENHKKQNSRIESHYLKFTDNDNSIIIDYGAHNAFYEITNITIKQILFNKKN